MTDIEKVARAQEAVMQSELKPCAHCGGEAESILPHIRWCLQNARELPASDAEITRLTEALRAAEEQVKGLREALGATESAIAEYYRYWTGGETRGSYDGKPERNALWRTREKARQTLAALKGPSHEQP